MGWTKGLIVAAFAVSCASCVADTELLADGLFIARDGGPPPDAGRRRFRDAGPRRPDAGFRDAGDAGDASPRSCAPEVLGSGAAELADMYRAMCERQAACGFPIFNHESNVEDCFARFRIDRLLASLGERGIEAYAEGTCACRLALLEPHCTALERGAYGDACARWFVGPSKDGDPCSIHFDCAAGFACQDESGRGECPGVCRAQPLSCFDVGCPSDRYCDVGGICSPRLPADAPCGIGVCIDGFFCGVLASDPFGTPVRCLRYRNEGEACVSADNSCGPGGVCANGVCVTDETLGASCTSNDDCPRDKFCDPRGSGCQPRAKLGEACFDRPNSCGAEQKCVVPEIYECGPGRTCANDGRCCLENGVGTCSMSSGRCEEVFGRCRLDRPPTSPERLLAPGAECFEGGHCPFGTACRSDGNGSLRCLEAYPLGARCEDGGFLSCIDGICDFFGTQLCVEEKLPGEPCNTTGFTFECSSMICEDGVCGDWDAHCR